MTRDNLVPPLLMGVVGLCCFPFGLVAGIWGLIAFLAARNAQRPPPPLAIACMGLCVLSLFTSGGLIFWAVRQNAHRDVQRAEVARKLEGRLEDDTLERDVACLLAEQFLLKHAFYEAVTCDAGDWQPGAIARLRVKALTPGAPELHTLCFARAHRWYVVMEPGDGKCPESAPPVSAKLPGSLDDEEDGLRADAAAARAKAVIEAFDGQVKLLRAATEVEHEERRCALEDEVKATYVDYDALPGAKNPQPPWKLLTHSEVQTALDPKLKAEDRAKAISALGGHVVVLQSDEVKVQPKATSNGFIMGQFEGWMTVVELSTGKVECDTRFTFVNNDTVGGGVRLEVAPKKSTQELADDDLEDQFEATANAAAKKMSGGKLKLRIGIMN